MAFEVHIQLFQDQPTFLVALLPISVLILLPLAFHFVPTYMSI